MQKTHKSRRSSSSYSRRPSLDCDFSPFKLTFLPLSTCLSLTQPSFYPKSTQKTLDLGDYPTANPSKTALLRHSSCFPFLICFFFILPTFLLYWKFSRNFLYFETPFLSCQSAKSFLKQTYLFFFFVYFRICFGCCFPLLRKCGFIAGIASVFGYWLRGVFGVTSRCQRVVKEWVLLFIVTIV